MKKSVFFVILLLTANLVFSQIRFGVYAHPQLAWFSSEEKTVTNDGVMFGFSAGLNIDKSIGDNENYFFSTGVLLNNTGGKLKYGTIADSSIVPHFHDGDIDTTIPTGTGIEYKLKYLQIPLSLKFKTNEIGYMKYYMQLGLTPQINIGAKGTASVNNISDEKMDEEFNMFSMGYHIGGGFDYSLGGNTALTVAVIYTAGFTDITTDKAIETNEAKLLTSQFREKDKIMLNSITLRVGLLF